MEEGFVGKGGFGGEEDNIEDVVVVANDLCSSMIQTILSVDFEEDINTISHELMSFGKSIIIKIQTIIASFDHRNRDTELMKLMREYYKVEWRQPCAVVFTPATNSDAGPSIEERAILFLEAQDRVKKSPLFKRA
ncbi:hypothetical protein Tco_0446190 [Tanacetum coccineum]